METLIRYTSRGGYFPVPEVRHESAILGIVLRSPGKKVSALSCCEGWLALDSECFVKPKPCSAPPRDAG